MKPAEILASLFPGGHQVASRRTAFTVTPLSRTAAASRCWASPTGWSSGVEDAAWLAREILGGAADGHPILLMIDSDSQRMSRRDELLGLSEYLAHLAKALLLAEAEGRRTVGLLYGHTAAGAFIATALAAGTLVALPGAEPEVMDLPSMARVTKLPLAVLKKMATATPVFAPGLDNLSTAGAVLEVWDPAQPLARQLTELLAKPVEGDRRDVLGRARGGRPKSAEIAARVFDLAHADA